MRFKIRKIRFSGKDKRIFALFLRLKLFRVTI